MILSWCLISCANNTATPAPINSLSSNSISVFSNSDGQQFRCDSRIIYNRRYKSIPKGSYNSNIYIVNHGDTLFYIAWITGYDFRNLAKQNHIIEPYSLSVGQSIQLDKNFTNAGSKKLMTTNVSKRGAPKFLSSDQMKTLMVNHSSIHSNSNIVDKKIALSSATNSIVTSRIASVSASSISSTSSVSNWVWPANGKIIDNFSLSEGGNKGVDIAGHIGQAIFSTAAGRVVYAGNALRGYGNLVIIKHNNAYLSAYAHNDTMLVREQQEVKAGQKVATMGSTGTSSVRLHFEIRYKGKSVNPLHYLPRR